MYIEKLKLKNFRSYEELEIEFSKNVNLITGENGQGKTNLAEAIYMLCYGKSFRTNKDKDMIMFEKENCFIHGNFLVKDRDRDIDIKLDKKKGKAIKVDNMNLSQLNQLYGQVNLVVFSPEDLKIISDGPIERRRFMDRAISHLKPVYINVLSNYNSTLANKNNMLKAKEPDQVLLDVYDSQLAALSKKIIDYRKNFIDLIKPIVKANHASISNNKEDLEISYGNNIQAVDEEEIYQEIKDHREKDLYRGYSTKGIHKDDICVSLNEIDLRNYGSQGQKKTAAISLKLSEIELVKKETSHYPIVILDDIYSELDEKRQKSLTTVLSQMQTFITSATDIALPFETNVIHIEKNGKISQIKNLSDK